MRRSDITAVVLTIGEPYVDRAIASLQRQTIVPADIVVVRNVSPFHRALNHGAAQVRTPFFVQVDADMVFDDTCFEELRGRMHDGLGLVSGQLRDPLLGRVHGARLYRTECFTDVQIRDTISPDVDFTRDIMQRGWGRLLALRYRGERREHWHTLGDHLPDYTPLYTFWKFILEGVRSRYRRHEGRVAAKFRQLRSSTHDAAPIALIATAHGLFMREQRDLLVPYQPSAEFEVLQSFLNSTERGAVDHDSPLSRGNGNLRDRFAYAYEHGFRCRDAGASTAFLAQLEECKRHDGVASWLTLVGMCHGLFHRHGNADAAYDAYASLSEILAAGSPW